MNNKILLCIDGTDESLAVVHYAAGVLSAKTCEITLLHVMNKVPEALLDTGQDLDWLEKVEKVNAFEEKQRTHITRFTDKCNDAFLTAGFSPDRIAVQISRQKNGIARDIVAEAQKKYHVLIIGRGRKGTGMPLGGVAGKIIYASLHPALWLVGAVHPAHKDILIGLDGSENSIKAVKHAGRMAWEASSRITLCNAARKVTMPFDDSDGIFSEFWGEQGPEDMARGFASAEKLARIWLNKSDIQEERIKTIVVSNVVSRAMALLREAKKNDCATIVIGRRGASEVVDFPMGRVTNKLIQLARFHALWVVN